MHLAGILEDSIKSGFVSGTSSEIMHEATAINGVDHVLVGVGDLEAARTGWLRLGFLPSPRGRHIGWGTANYCIMFPNDYIELLGIVDPKQFTNNLDRFLDQREGLLGVAFASDDPEASARVLRARGIQVRQPKDLSRIIELPKGDALPSFKLLDLPAGAAPGLSAFLCHHLSRNLVWQDAWCHHPNGARGLLAITVVVDQPAEVAIPYGELFGFDAVLVRDGSVEIDTGGPRLIFVAPQWLQRTQPGLLSYPSHPTPWIAGLRLEVANGKATAYYFDQTGVSYRKAPGGALLVAPALANGVILEFVEGPKRPF